MLSRRMFALGLMTQAAGILPGELYAQEGRFLTEAAAPAAIFPQATTFERTVVPSTPELRAQMQTQLGTLRPSLWEAEYIIFTAKQREMLLGYGVIVEEIGKSLPITFILAQYAGKTLRDPLLPYRDIHNITGATLSCQSIGQGVRKALALVHVLFPKERGS